MFSPNSGLLEISFNFAHILSKIWLLFIPMKCWFYLQNFRHGIMTEYHLVAPWSFSICTIWPFADALFSAVSRYWSWIFTSASCSSKILTIWSWPSHDASINAVQPYLSLVFTPPHPSNKAQNLHSHLPLPSLLSTAAVFNFIIMKLLCLYKFK